MTTDIQQFIQTQVTSNPVVLYIKGTAKFPQCGFSSRVVQIMNMLNQFGKQMMVDILLQVMQSQMMEMFLEFIVLILLIFG